MLYNILCTRCLHLVTKVLLCNVFIVSVEACILQYVGMTYTIYYFHPTTRSNLKALSTKQNSNTKVVVCFSFLWQYIVRDRAEYNNNTICRQREQYFYGYVNGLVCCFGNTHSKAYFGVQCFTY